MSKDEMDPATLEALKSSIKKWEAIARGEGQDDGAFNCALCQLFHPDFAPCVDCSMCGCLLCPVGKRTGKSGCRGTPYEEWESHHRRKHPETADELTRKVLCDECRRIAQKEMNFLQSLLPKKTKKKKESQDD